MTAKRSTPDPRASAAEPGALPPAPVVAPVTGVASGGFGTAANLEETQVLRTANLEAFQALEAERSLTPEPGEAASPGEPVVRVAAAPIVASQPTAPPDAATPVAFAPAPVHAVAAARTRSTRTTSNPKLFAGMAGVLAVVLVVLAGLAILTTNGNSLAGPGGAPPAAGSTPTAEPATADPDTGGSGGGKGHGKGNDGKGGH